MRVLRISITILSFLFYFKFRSPTNEKNKTGEKLKYLTVYINSYLEVCVNYSEIVFTELIHDD